MIVEFSRRATSGQRIRGSFSKNNSHQMMKAEAATLNEIHLPRRGLSKGRSLLQLNVEHRARSDSISERFLVYFATLRNAKRKIIS
jgi:hypothetical protein